MKLDLDFENRKLVFNDNELCRTVDLYSDEAFGIISQAWLKVGWNQKYTYTFTWLGRPVIQLPEDIIRCQEAIFCVQPDVIIETGIAHGGSLIFYASLCKMMGRGRVIGIDIEIRSHNRVAIEEHPLFDYITLIEGSSVSPKVVNHVGDMVKEGESVMVFLDSNHSKQHVLEELRAYSSLVTPSSYIVATDGIMKELNDVPRGDERWSWDNPSDAAIEFLKEHREFKLERPPWRFNESSLSENVTHWPGAWLKRL